MKIGVYLPTYLPGTDVRDVHDWARRAEQLGLDTVAITDRGATEPWGPLPAAAVMAVSTERVALFADITFRPVWTPEVHAQHALAMHRIIGDRYGTGVTFTHDAVLHAATEAGLYADDADAPIRMVDGMLAEIHHVWRAAMGPAAPDFPLVIGGTAEVAAGRIARNADGWLLRSGTPEQLATGMDVVRDAWAAAGRPGRPTATAVLHFALGDDASTATETQRRRYTVATGAEVVAASTAGTATGANQIREHLEAFAAAGADQVLAMASIADLDQLDGLAAALPQPTYS